MANLTTLSGALLSASCCSDFEKVKQITSIVPKDDFERFIAHVSFEIHQLVYEFCKFDNNGQRCCNYLNKRQTEYVMPEDMK